MVDFRKQKLCDFVAWARQHITGDEKGEAQIFLDRLFQAFGQGGIREAGATLEMRVRQADNKGTAFADLVWKPVVLIEMKKRGEDLTRHYRQAFDYWTRLVPGRPRYVVLCNFDEFQVYDFQTQMDVPVDALGFAGAGDILAQLLELNLQVAGRIEQAQPVTAPGVPPTYPTPAELVTPDCIGPGAA